MDRTREGRAGAGYALPWADYNRGRCGRRDATIALGGLLKQFYKGADHE